MKRFDVGSRVVEPTYGLGSVVAVEDNYTRVQFDEHGMKKFLTSMSRLEPSNEPVPPGWKGKPVQRFSEIDIPSPDGETMVVQREGCFSTASRKSPISLRLLTTLWAMKRPPLSRRG